MNHTPISSLPGRSSILRRVFQGLDESNLETLRSVAERKTYPAGTILCYQGAIEHTFYIVVSGRVAILQTQEDGSERLLAICGPNQYFGEIALLDNSPRLANCTTLTETTVLEVTEAIFDQVVESSPVVAHTIVQSVLATLRENDQQAIRQLRAKNEELRQAYTALQQAQAALVEKERLERELEIAATVQRNLLPSRLPQFPDCHFAAYLQPARLVGGDYYDVFVLDDERVGMLIADVSDKSIHASLIMAVTRTLFHVECKRCMTPVEVILAVHNGLLDISQADEMFVTAFYGVLHRPTGRLSYVLAGQERPLLVRQNEPVGPISGRGRFMGMFPDLRLDQFELMLRPGDKLVLFSDGVPDATNDQDQQYGHQRLTALLEQHGPSCPAGALAQQIAQDVFLFTGNAPPFDDLTLLIVEFIHYGPFSKTP